MTYYIHKADPTTIDAVGFRERRTGVEVRDCILVQGPGGKCALRLLTRTPEEATFIEGIVRGNPSVIDIDGSRVKSAKWDQEAMERCNSPRSGNIIAGDGKLGTFHRKTPYKVDTSKGRFPTNLILRHGPTCECIGTKKVKGSNPIGPNPGIGGKNTYGESWSKRGLWYGRW